MMVQKLKTEAELEEFLDYAANLPTSPISCDLETTGLRFHDDRITHCVLGFEGRVGVLAVSDFSSPDALLQRATSLANPYVFHHMAFDLKMLYKAGVDIWRWRDADQVRDTMLLDHLVDENLSHSLDSLVQRHYQDNYKELFWGKYDRFEDAPEAEALDYAAKDGYYTDKLYREKYQGLNPSLVKHAHSLAWALLETEIRGVAVDKDYLLARGVELQTKITQIRPELRSMVENACNAIEMQKWGKELDKRKTERGKAAVPRPEFSFDSSSQVQELLYRQLKLPVQVDYKTKRPTVGDGALVELMQAHPLIPKLREYREHQKVYTAYIEGTLERLWEGRIYPSFNVNGTKTGRISHSDPNLGQLPSSGGIRGIYVPDPGHCFVSADYDSLEIFLAAHFSQDEVLLKVVREGVSLHDITAEALGIPRAKAKTLNFAIQFGAREKKVSQILECSQKEAEGMLRKYWEKYRGLKAFMDRCASNVDNGVQYPSPYGRVRHLSPFGTKWEKAKAHRQAFNSIIQGTGGDLTSEAFYETVTEMRRRNLGVGLWTVHDECLIMPKDGCWEEAQALLLETMVNVPLRRGIDIGLKAKASGKMLRWEDK